MARQPREDPAWQNLARLLTSRRVALDPRYRNRRVFCAEKNLDYRVISDIEGARRDNFSAPMVTAIEVAYEIADGGIRSALADPGLTELPIRSAPASPVPAMGTVRELAVSVPDWVSLGDLEPWEQHLWRTPHLSEDERASAIRIVRLLRGTLTDDTKDLLALSSTLNRIITRHLQNEQNPGQAG